MTTTHQIVFPSRTDCLRQVRALTQWARRTGIIGPSLHATDADRFVDGTWGHGYCPWMEPAHGAIEILRGNPHTIDLHTGRRDIATGLVDIGDGTLVETRGCLETVRTAERDP